jgi:hypothetical protein
VIGLVSAVGAGYPFVEKGPRDTRGEKQGCTVLKIRDWQPYREEGKNEYQALEFIVSDFGG